MKPDPLGFNKAPNTVRPRRIPGGIIFYWTRKGVGFGTLTMRVTHGKLQADTEFMGATFCANVVKQAIEEAMEK